MLVGTYVGWAASAALIVQSDVAQHPSILQPASDQEELSWGKTQWLLAAALAGGFALPFYCWTTRGTPSDLLRGVMMGIFVTLLALALRVLLSVLLEVPVF